MLGTFRVGAGGDVLTGGVEGGGPPGTLCSPGGPAHVYAQPPAPPAQVPVCTPALYVPVAGMCVDEQMGQVNGCFGFLGSWTPSLDRRP